MGRPPEADSIRILTSGAGIVYRDPATRGRRARGHVGQRDDEVRPGAVLRAHLDYATQCGSKRRGHHGAGDRERHMREIKTGYRAQAEDVDHAGDPWERDRHKEHNRVRAIERRPQEHWRTVRTVAIARSAYEYPTHPTQNQSPCS